MDHKIFQQKISWFFLLTVLLLSLFSTVIVADVNEIQRIANDKLLFTKAVAFSSQQQWSQAEPIYRDLLKRNEQWPELGNNLAILLLKTNRLDEAKKVFEQAVSSSPGYRVTQKNRSQLYSYLATQAYDKALGSKRYIAIPELELIQTIHQPVKVIEKIVEKSVEKVVIKTVSVEKKQPDVQLEAESFAVEQKNIHRDIKQQLLDWSQAWSRGDFEPYIQSYSEAFLPSDARKSYVEWKNIRRARLKFTKGVKVDIGQLRVFVESGGEYALVEFMQNYRSSTYNDRVLKQMYMHYQQDNWLILSERTIKKY